MQLLAVGQNFFVFFCGGELSIDQGLINHRSQRRHIAGLAVGGSHPSFVDDSQAENSTGIDFVFFQFAFLCLKRKRAALVDDKVTCGSCLGDPVDDLVGGFSDGHLSVPSYQDIIHFQGRLSHGRWYCAGN